MCGVSYTKTQPGRGALVGGLHNPPILRALPRVLVNPPPQISTRVQPLIKRRFGAVMRSFRTLDTMPRAACRILDCKPALSQLEHVLFKRLTGASPWDKALSKGRDPRRPKNEFLADEQYP